MIDQAPTKGYFYVGATIYCTRSLFNVATCHGMSNHGFSFLSSTTKWHEDLSYPKNIIK